MFSENNFREKIKMSGVNSINWARIICQIVYYFYSYFKFQNKKVSFAVPTGNFGDVFAGYVAKKMGLPIEKLIVATNENDILENKSLLLENNFDNLNAIDWDKGCYVGQEITARMKYRGLLKKKLYALKIKSGDVLEGDELIVDNKKIGTIVSKANSNIFAALNINFVNEIKNKTYKGEKLLSLFIFNPHHLRY